MWLERDMRQRKLAAAFLALCAMGIASPVSAETISGIDGFKRIRGGAIPKLISGKEFSDGVHWRYSFHPSGALTEYAMRRRRDLRCQRKDDALCWRSEQGDECSRFGHRAPPFGSSPLG
jgi:hypothetical protein